MLVKRAISVLFDVGSSRLVLTSRCTRDWEITPFRPHHIFYVLRLDLNKMLARTRDESHMTDAEAPRLAALVPG